MRLMLLGRRDTIIVKTMVKWILEKYGMKEIMNSYLSYLILYYITEYVFPFGEALFSSLFTPVYR